MECSMWIFLGITSVLVISTAANDQYINEGAQIFNTIFHKYSVKVPPRKSFPNAITLAINVDIIHVLGVNADTKVMTSTFDLEVSWPDSRLSWYPKSVQEIVIPLKEVWSPDLSITNAVGKVEEISSSKVVLKATGEVRWKRRMKAETLCQANELWSVCSVDIGSDLFDEKVVSFDKDISQCSEEGAVTANHINLAPLPLEFPSVTSSENSTYAGFSCSFNVTLGQDYRDPELAYIVSASSSSLIIKTDLWVLIAAFVLVVCSFAQIK